jgi:tryptophan 5-monooxygenase
LIDSESEGQLIDFISQLYFFTVEFGLCKQADGSFKVYGAGLLSSVAELQHAITTKEKIKKFDPDITCYEECIITSYQNAYYYTDSFDEAKEQMRTFAETIKRPFMVRYNPYTQSVEVLSNAKKITAVMSELRGDLSIVSSALKKISALDENLDVETLSQMLLQGIHVSHVVHLKRLLGFKCLFPQIGDKSPVSDSSDNSQKSQ